MDAESVFSTETASALTITQGCHSIFITKYPDFSLTFAYFQDFRSKRSGTFLCNIQSNFNGSNTFGTIKISSRQG